MTDYPAIHDELTRYELQVVSDCRLADYTTFHLGGPCPLLVECATTEQIRTAVSVLAAADVPFRLIGGGSNLLVADEGLDMVVIRYVSTTPKISRQANCLEVSGATSLDALAEYSVNAGLADMVNASGIPGTVGGAIVGNAGAFGWQMGDALSSIRLLNRAGQIRDVLTDEIGFSYRDSGLKATGDIVISAVFELPADDVTALREKRQNILQLRVEKHPDLSTCSCAGSFFRNVEPTSNATHRNAAGGFLDQAGAKTMRVGGAGVFARHANIIIKATDDCRSADVLALSNQMAAAVKERFQISLVREVQLLGHFDT